MQYPDLAHFQINGTNYTPSQLFQDDSVFELLQSQSNVRYRTHNGSFNALKPFSQIEKEIQPQLTYSQRKERFSKLSDGLVSTLNSKLINYEKELEGIQRLSLSQLVISQSDLAFSELDVDDDLIKYLIIEGLIGEDFLTYTTYFYPGELSSNDQQYLISQLSNTPLDIAYKLDNPEKVFEKIKEERFKSLAILNLDMLTFVSLNKTGTNKASNLIGAIIDSEDSGNNLLYNWFKLAGLEDASKRYVLNKITKKDENFWLKYFDGLNLTSGEKGNLLISLLQHLDDEALKLLNNTGFIQFEVNENLELLNSIGMLGYDKLEKLFRQSKLVFSDISGCNDIRLLGVIEKTSAYEITIGNLIKLLSASNQPSENIVPTYSYILQNGSLALKKYIERELRWFAGSVLENLENPKEQESAVLQLLKSDELETELKISLIQKLIFKVIDIGYLADQSLWPELLKSKRVIANWSNVIKYFSSIGQVIDEVLKLYLSDEENIGSLVNGGLKHTVPDELKLARQIISCDEIEDGAYEKLLKGIWIRFGRLDDIKVNENKLKTLLISKKFTLTVENHQFLKTNLPEKSYLLLEQNFDEFIENLSEIAAESYELISLLSFSGLDRSQKINLIKLTPDSLYDADLAKTYCEYVLNRTRKNVLDIRLIKKILSFDYDQDLKIRLFNRYSDQLDHAAILEIVSKMRGMQKSVSNLVDNKYAVLPKNSENLMFANYLSANGYINLRNYKKSESQIELIPKMKITNQ